MARNQIFSNETKEKSYRGNPQCVKPGFRVNTDTDMVYKVRFCQNVNSFRSELVFAKNFNVCVYYRIYFFLSLTIRCPVLDSLPLSGCKF